MITSTSNDRVKRIVTLQEKSRTRVKEHVFIAEGLKMFEEAPVSQIREIYIEQELLREIGGQDSSTAENGYAKLRDKLSECKSAGIPYESVTKEVFLKMSDTKTPQGILCVMERNEYDSEKMIKQALIRQEKEGRAPLFLLLEDIQDPGNLGTMVRTAEGAGADGIFMTKGCVDIYNPKTIRSTMGSLYRVPFCCTESMEEVITALQQNHIQVYAAHLKGTRYYHEMDYSSGSAFLIGNEGNGLKKETADKADCYVKIPMEGKLESLNAAVSAALFMYQAAEWSQKQIVKV